MSPIHTCTSFSHYADYIRIVCNKQSIQKDTTLQKKHRRLKLTCLEASESLGGGNSYISNFYPYILGETIQFHSYFLKWIGSTTNKIKLFIPKDPDMS